ncbi:MAG: hypothetical protein IJZ46_00525 [Bacilli bacterium]|nr:hypothetical protein [Bacilli bacterium]
MIRGNTLIESVAKLNTYILMNKSHESLKLYINKILTKQCKNLKFIHDYDHVPLDLLYTSLQIMNTNDISLKELNKIDKKELKYYIGKTKGIPHFRKMNSTIKDEESFINYIKRALSNGEYVCNHNNTVKFDNGIVLDSTWLIEFSHFIINSLNINSNLSLDSKTYSFKTIQISEKKDNIKNFIKDIKLYEYNVTRKDNKILTYQNVEYLINILSQIDNYDFKQLQDINSELSKEQYCLSINKLNVNFNKDSKVIIEKYINEEMYEELVEYIKDYFNCNDSKSKKNKRKLIRTFEMIRSISHAYKNNYSLDECRKLFDLNEQSNEIKNAIAIADFYITYIYDQSNLLKYFNYELLDLNLIKPNIIDYDNNEYKIVLNDLSSLNKKVVSENKKINKLIDLTKHQKDDAKTKELDECCNSLGKLIQEANELRNELNSLKNSNRTLANINKTKIKYIKEAISSGKYTYNSKEDVLVFVCNDKKDQHKTFELEIKLEEFEQALLNETNKNIRINFYQL